MTEYDIVLADKHVLMRECVKDMINSASQELKVVAEVGDGPGLLTLLNKTKPDMIVLDISMSGLRGVDAAKEIRDRYPDAKILFLTMHKSGEFLSKALEVGANGYLLKEDISQELLVAIQEIRNGHTYVSRKLRGEFPSEITWYP